MFCKYCGNRLDDQAKFCPTCGKPVESAPSPAQNRPLRCPGCGSQISALDAVCPACGYEVRARSGMSTMEEFRKAYDAIEGGDENFLSSLKNFFSFKSTSSKAEKQASLISSFSVPCTKEDLHEFLLLSATHFDPEFLALTEPPGGMFLDDFNDEMLLQKAWFAKFQQVYETAKTSFRQDTHSIIGDIDVGVFGGAGPRRPTAGGARELRRQIARNAAHCFC